VKNYEFYAAPAQQVLALSFARHRATLEARPQSPPDGARIKQASPRAFLRRS